MSEKISVGLTGGIAAGKSTVSDELRRLGAEIIDADEIYAYCVRPGSEGLARLAEEFGPDIIAEDGSLNRPALGSLVFEDELARQKLNAIAHPMVREEAQRRIAASSSPVIVEDIPLLTETRQHERFDLVLVVEADHGERVQRMLRHRKMDEQQANARIASQATDEERRAIADVVLRNDGDVEELRQQVHAFWEAHILPRLNSQF